jgi:predicted phage terminase large subunit-like protein
MMQEPSPSGGGLFKREWWRYYTIEPEFEYRMMYADTAMKTAEQNDYSVMQCWGKYKNDIYLIDQIRGKWEAPQLLTTAKAFWSKHKNSHKSVLRKLEIEDKASGTGLIQQLKQDKIPVRAIQRNNDKVTRAYDSAPSIEAGNVYLNINAEYLNDYLTEFDLFPLGKHDDQVDPTMDAIANMIIKQKPTPSVRSL